MRGGYYSYESRFIRSLPIRTISGSDHDEARHGKIVGLVKSLLALYKRLAAAKSEAQKTVLQRQIDSAEAALDRQVYELYDLTTEQIALVEAAVE